jgi:hypothetical protein
VEDAAKEVPLKSAVPSRLSVNVAEDVAVLVTAMLVTTVVVLVVGTVYRVAEDVAAAVRARVFAVTAIRVMLPSE